MASSPPNNFSWVEPGKLAGLALPRMPCEYRYLLDNGIKHLVCLCERKPPNHDSCPELQLHHIKIADFTPPSPSQIDRFLSIVEEANSKGELLQEHHHVHIFLLLFLLFASSLLNLLQPSLELPLQVKPAQSVVLLCAPVVLGPELPRLLLQELHGPKPLLLLQLLPGVPPPGVARRLLLFWAYWA
uniref:Dual specificity phosphatase 23a n=1 Tax=Fundulus heteroclitus TaxID=8078 RepID=A0A3Q2NTP6_FUNHE